MRRIKKRLLAWLMAVAMVFGVIHVSPSMVVEAEDGVHGITLGIPSWNDDRTQYTFPDVTVNMEGGADNQKVLCISVSDKGYFSANLSSIYNTVDISGVRKDGNYADNSGTPDEKIKQLSKTENEDLISITILGNINDDDIKTFIKSLTFYRNGAAISDVQKVSVVSSPYDVRQDGGTALAIDGKLHIYKYIDWDEEQKQSYVGLDSVNVPASEVSGSIKDWTWFKAYELAKKQKVNGLKGYLATITSVEEQAFIYNKFGAIRTVSDTENGAWIGGARTFSATTTDSSEKSDNAAKVVFDADTMPELYPADSKDGLTGTRAKGWRWMCGPESQTEAKRNFFTLTSADAHSSAGTTNTYAKWSVSGESEPNNFPTSNKYGQEFCLQYGYEEDGGWNDWGPEHSPRSNDVASETGSGEGENYKAPAGFIVEFSPYDINKNGKDDSGEVPTTPYEEDLTIITAQPHIVDAKLDKTIFKYTNDPSDAITVTSVIGDYIVNDGVPSDELITENKVPKYQWEYFDEESNTWKNATGTGANTKSYTPNANDVGRKLRVHITATDDDATNNPNHYVGDIYLDATGSDDQTNKIKGTVVEYDGASVTGNDFMVAKGTLSTITSDAIINKYSRAVAKIEDGASGTVKDISDDEINTLKGKKAGESSEITLVNSKYPGITDTVTATVFDNATDPALDKNSKTSQIGSDNFTVLQGSGPLGLEDVVEYGNVTVITDGKKATGNYTIDNNELVKLNEAIANGTSSYDVPVEDQTTGLKTTITVTIVPLTNLELESAKLSPYKGKDENGKWKHYYAGDTITVDEIKIKGVDVPLKGSQLTDGSFDYEWQYWNGNGEKDWKEIGVEGTTAITLSSDYTTNYAKNKVQVVITPVGDKFDTTKVEKLYVDGDGFSKKENIKPDETTGGTYIDIFTIDANDFVISLKEAQEIDDSKAATAARVLTEIINYSSDGTKTVTTTPTSNVKDADGLANVTEAKDVPVKFNATTTVESQVLDARDKDSQAAIGKTVTAFVKDSAKTETLEDGSKIGIGANNITITVAEAREILKDGSITTQARLLSNDAKVVVVDGAKSTQADALKYNEGDGSVTITYDSENTFDAKKGTYPVTYTYTNAAGKTVSSVANVTVISNAKVDAKDFIISIKDAKTVEEDAVENKANATGKDDAGNTVGNDKLDVKDDDLNSLHSVDKPGDVNMQISNTSAEPNPTVTVKAHVVDETGTDDTKKITIGANNFDIYPEDVQKALDGDTDILKKFAGVIAMDNGADVSVSSIQVTDAYKTDLKTEPGTYPVTFTYNGVQVTVDATVKVPSIDAHDFIISTSEAKTVTEDIVKDKSGAQGVDEDSNPVDKGKLDIDDTAINAIKDAGNSETPKDISVTVTNTSNEPYPTKTVTAHVVDETGDNKSTENDPAKQITIGANNFFISPEDAQKAIDGDDTILKTLSEVLAIKGYKDVPVTDITVSDKSKLKTEAGSYPITFAYDGVSVTVDATVKAPDASKSTIDAHDIIISVNDAKNVTEDSIKDSSDVSGKNQYDNPLKPADVDVKDDDVTTIKNTTTPDQLTVELTNTTGSQPKTTIDVYVVDETATNGNNDPVKKITIGANNFDISVDDAQKAIDGDDPILRQLSAVVAVAGGENVKTSDIKVSDKSKLKAEPGKYPVTFSYTKDGDTVEVTVDAIVKANSGSKDPANKDDNNKDNGEGEQITGNDFTVEGGSTPLTPKDIIDKGNVDDVDGNGTPIVLPPDSSVNKDDLDKLNEAIKDGKKGTYPVKVTSPNPGGPTVTINVTVTDKNDSSEPTDPSKTGETIAANNFKIGVNDFDKIFGDPTKKDEIVKKLSNAEAYDTELKTPVDITSVDTTNVKGEPGVYPVTLTTANGTSTTINVTVDGDWDTIGDIDKASDSNKTDETVDNDTAKKIVPVVTPTPTGTPAPTATSGTSQPVNPEDIVYEKTNPQDKTEPIDPSKQVPATGALTINGVPVDQYTVSPDGTKLIINKDFLNTLSKGSYPAVLTYADGTTQQFNVTIVDFDEATLVKNPPLFSMYKEIVLKKKNTFTVNLKGITDYAVVTSKITGKGKKAKSVVKIKQQKNGDVLITPKKVGKTQVTCTIIQNGAEYKVVVDLKVLKQYKGTSKNYNLKPKGLVKTSGELPEFNVYKRIVKGKNTKIKFTKVATDAKVKFYVANKKEAKSLKIGKIKRKGKTATCTIKGKKKGWVHLTAEITQNGKTYYTRLLVRIDDGTWTKKQIKKYLK